MRVLFDHQVFELQRWGGISRYFVELMRGLRRGIDVDLALARTRSEHLPTLNELLAIGATDFGFRETLLGGARFPGKGQLFSVVKRLFPPADARRVNRRLALEKLRAGRFDLFHPTYYDPYFLEALGDRPYVLTVHDCTHEVYPEHFSPRDPTAARKRRLAHGARRILAVSEQTRRDVVRLLGVDPDKVDVVHHGFAARAGGGDAPWPRDLPERYVLFAGSRGRYKNWAFFVRAIAPLLRDERPLDLVCTGDPFSAAEREYVGSLGLSDRVLHVSPGDAGLQALYERAAVFVLPSLYEGFGLPVLEAFAAGCPAAVSGTSSLPEVGGDAALYFDPKDGDSIRDAVGRLLSDTALRTELIARGKARVAEFTWEKTAAATIATYHRALEAR
jgi:glycosyltransferase involved in cell wall biosynthesis